ncbi:hypothetical protein BO83DRAFT_379871 [Aspergillus eucalypticola CBS 122712]|uniref:Spherulin 4-like cell surface protein n=1 Tax=Aspergillus eucalypticola (strain CBS 122712 / IBT 29274) TaxID=1448314 RepID=A0A317V7V9_ASPEC|nr:uncharacterized protein BO83DRAFT_379871 [Aspergillus eucalypticola CBS 122712]PWY69361.1 hypothetical protein BO83DRAFT_379871 [Aspergillus eucalypticola CBS 122712]
MFGSTSRLILGMLSCVALLPSQALAAHQHVGHRHHHPINPTQQPQPSTLITIAQGSAPTEAPSACYWAPSAVSSVIASASASAAAVVESNITAKVIIPFYVYPEAGAWTPMEELVAAFPNVHFTIIINPDSGPGSSSLPDSNFLTAVPRLTSYSNVLAIGYVPTEKGTRAISDVESDIKTYAGWPSASGNSSFAVHGIFLDEAPNAYSEELVSYYQQLANLIKESSGLGPENFVVTNPGTVPDSAYLTIPDSTVVFESPYDSFLSAMSDDSFSAIRGGNHSALATMVYSVPDSVHLPTLISQVGNISDQIFLGNTSSYTVYNSYMNQVIPLLLPVSS